MTLANLSILQQYTLDIEPEGCLTLPQEIQEILHSANASNLPSSLYWNEIPFQNAARLEIYDIRNFLIVNNRRFHININIQFFPQNIENSSQIIHRWITFFW